ncbi:hypothetical protein L207DRAFT_636226 [Hyaloscypha variabilis F]|uniref:DUF6594 domain-containing protein n=1 Tax=Hyaloscypha variabilis (strain UAMH 11265 / GT02V1 / F) TaxID=1149755 RepID=A0A2J6RG98_HYAVF|nr:hypothetical protein L207DRAFT_636226 [Hyaloscypha variabilis F]
MEAEIFELQKQQDDLDIRDSRGDPDTVQCFRSWKKLRSSTDPGQLERIELILKIRERLKEYHEALVLQEAVLKMGKPHAGTVEAFKLWLDGKSEGPGGRHAPSFSGLSAARLNNEEDLVALHPAFDKDWLATLAELPYLRLLCLDSHVDESIALFSMRKTKRAVGILSMLLAAIMFTVSIVSLYLVTNNTTRLGLICAFTVMLAAILQLLTNASRTELFACTAAYAAVLVVFVSGNLGSTCCNTMSTGG